MILTNAIHYRLTARNPDHAIVYNYDEILKLKTLKIGFLKNLALIPTPVTPPGQWCYSAIIRRIIRRFKRNNIITKQNFSRTNPIYKQSNQKGV